jgi:hypothetical protein
MKSATYDGKSRQLDRETTVSKNYSREATDFLIISPPKTRSNWLAANFRFRDREIIQNL